MAIFQYSAMTLAGRLMNGTIEASSQQQAVEMLQEMKLSPTEVSKAPRPLPQTPVGRSEFLLFNQQLASITKAQIPLEQGLRQLAQDVASRKMRGIVNDIADELEAGVPVDAAIKKRQKHFPPLYGLILKAGVESGRLSEMLTSLNRQLEVGSRTRRIVIEAMCYPLLILAIGATIITLLFIWVIPPAVNVLMDVAGGTGLPLLTRFFVAAAGYVVPLWCAIGIAIVALIIIYNLLSSSPAGRRFKESLLMRLPIAGKVYCTGVLTRMAHAMAVLVGANTDMPTSLRLAAGSGGSEKMKLECELLAAQIEQGHGLMESGASCRMIPRLFLYSMQLGSQRNELQDNLNSLAQMYGDQTKCLQSRLQAFLLPAMIIFVGLFVGLGVAAIFMPLIRIGNVLM